MTQENQETQEKQERKEDGYRWKNEYCKFNV